MVHLPYRAYRPHRHPAARIASDGGAALILLALSACGGAAPHAVVTPSPSIAPTPSPSPSPIAPSPSPSPQPAQKMEPPLPVPLEESAAAAAGGKLYVMGGFDAVGRSLSTVYVFDGTAWSDGPRLPLGVDHPAAATVDAHVYLSGGHSGASDSARVFRLDGGSWTEVAPMAHARGGHTLVAAGGRLYAIGGNTAAGNVAETEVYDPQSGRWSELPAMPAARNHVAGFTFAADVCAAGGRAPNTARVDCFNLESLTWERLLDLPRPTSGAGAATLDDGRVIVMGGQDAQESRIVDQLARLPSSSQWTATETMLVPRHGFELAVFEGRAWACGGGSLAGLHPVPTCTSVL